MGVFVVRIEVAKPSSRPAFRPVRKVMVDTVSEATWIAAEILKRSGITVRKKDQPFVMANGQQITRDVGYAVLRCGDFETVDEVVFAKPGDLQLLGARTLEGFNARVDPRGKRLVAAGPMPAATSIDRASRPLWDAATGVRRRNSLTARRHERPPSENGAVHGDTY